MVTFPWCHTLSYPKAQGGISSRKFTQQQIHSAADSFPSSLPHIEFPNLLPQAVFPHLTKANTLSQPQEYFGKWIIVVTICFGDKYLLEWMRQSLKEQVFNLKEGRANSPTLHPFFLLCRRIQIGHIFSPFRLLGAEQLSLKIPPAQDGPSIVWDLQSLEAGIVFYQSTATNNHSLSVPPASPSHSLKNSLNTPLCFRDDARLAAWLSALIIKFLLTV